jgi:hypothetical protein|tara:strand:+ start:538 stop:783 length:246 start_codon:yes stop_codon:yes gene_type:complete
MIKPFTVEFHQAEVEITRINSVTGEKETFSTYPTIGLDKIKTEKPTGIDWFEVVASDWDTPTKKVASSRVVADWGIQSATR